MVLLIAVWNFFLSVYPFHFSSSQTYADTETADNVAAINVTVASV